MYGPKKGPLSRFNRLNIFMLHVGFTSLKTGLSFFILAHGVACVYLIMYFDDILIMGRDSGMVNCLFKIVVPKFHIKDLSSPHFFHGI